MAKRFYISTVAEMPEGGSGGHLSPMTIRLMNAVKDGKAHKILVDHPSELKAMQQRIRHAAIRIDAKVTVRTLPEQSAVYFQGRRAARV